MKIAQIAPLYESVPPRLYGGTERIVAHLTDALVELGHEVTLFASAEARTKAHLVPVRDQAIRLDPAPLKSDLAAHLAQLHKVRARRHEFDILHFHIDLLHFPIFTDHAPRTVTTLHGRLDCKDLPAAYACWPQYPLVSISDAQRTPLPQAHWCATIGNMRCVTLKKTGTRKTHSPTSIATCTRRASLTASAIAKIITPRQPQASATTTSQA